jgi:phage/plasmid-associated DNA primase
MLELKTKQALAKEAHSLAGSCSLVRYHNQTYMPVDFESMEYDPPPEPDRTIWVPMTQDKLRRVAAKQYDTLFGNDAELRNFEFMVAQNSDHKDRQISHLLIKTADGLKLLSDSGELKDVDGQFVPNAIVPKLNTKKKDKDRVLKVIQEWVGSKEEAESLLYHLATALAPGWSAVKYIILLGEGRNGKSVLLKMLMALFGRENVSSVTRQHISERSPVVTDLNGKLLNIVFDGQSTYLKDSGDEKSLVAGETVAVKKLYESTPVLVQTTALFIEGLNREPKSHDKSSALQKRIVRFLFPNTYELDHKFEREMLSEDSLGAFLSILIDHYVKEDEAAAKLAPTKQALELQLEHMFVNSVGLQFLKYVEETDVEGAVGLLEIAMPDLVQRFQSWRVRENDLSTWAEPDVLALFNSLVNTERRTKGRVGGTPRKVRVLTSFKPEARAFLDSLMEGADDEQALEAALVAD